MIRVKSSLLPKTMLCGIEIKFCVSCLNYQHKRDAIERCLIIYSRSINSIYYHLIFVCLDDDNLILTSISMFCLDIFWNINIAFKVHFIFNKVLNSMCENLKIIRWQLVRQQQLSSNYETRNVTHNKQIRLLLKKCCNTFWQNFILIIKW